jgi:hypothetical protein
MYIGLARAFLQARRLALAPRYHLWDSVGPSRDHKNAGDEEVPSP